VKTSSRPKIKFLQLPLSVLSYLRTLTSKAASDLLVYLCQRTIGFGESSVTLTYNKIAEVLEVDSRTVARVAKLLEDKGFISREQTAHRVYRWRVVLQKDDIIADPDKTLTTTPTNQVMTSMSGPTGHQCHDHDDINVMTQPALTEHPKACQDESPVAPVEQNERSLKRLNKDKDLKKQHQNVKHPEKLKTPMGHQPQPAARSAVDEPLHKLCLRELIKLGVSQRVARELCRENDHQLIVEVLKTAPHRPRVKNLPAYIVSEIKDGGYRQERVETNAKPQPQTRQLREAGSQDAPVTYRTPEQTQQEHQSLEKERVQKEQSYREQGRVLASRFLNLANDVQLRLKLLASIQLTKELPQTGNREQMLKDRTFQRLANRTVLERFFDWLDKGLDTGQALKRLESSFA